MSYLRLDLLRLNGMGQCADEIERLRRELAEARELLRALWNDESDWREEVSREMYDRIDAFLAATAPPAPGPAE